MALKKTTTTASTSTMACVRCKAKHARCQRESPTSPCNRCNWNKVQCEDPEPPSRMTRIPTPPPAASYRLAPSVLQMQQQHQHQQHQHQQAAFGMAAYHPNVYYPTRSQYEDLEETFYPYNYDSSAYPALHQNYYTQKYQQDSYQPLPEFYPQHSNNVQTTPHHVVTPPTPPYEWQQELHYYNATPMPLAASEGPMAKLYQSGEAAESLREVWGTRSNDIQIRLEDSALLKSWNYAAQTPTPTLSDDGSSCCFSDTECDFQGSDQTQSPMSSYEYVPQQVWQQHVQKDHDATNFWNAMEI